MSSSETNLWPEYITSQEFLKPKEILQSQAKILSDQMKGKVLGEIDEVATDVQDDPKQSRITLQFFVVAANEKLRIKILDVTYRKKFDYPAAITYQSELPTYLRKKYYKPGRPAFATLGLSIMGEQSGKWIDNEGVCSTPDEFREKLEETLATAEVKSAVMAVLAAASEEIDE